MKRLVQLVADYGPGDLAYAEFIQRLALAVPDAIVHLTRVAPNDTLAAGFCLAQLAFNDGPEGRVVTHDVAVSGAVDDRMCFGRTVDGTWVVGANTGWALSFAVDELPGLCHLDVSVASSVLPMAIAHVTKRHPHALCDPVDRASVPPVPERAVAYIDAAGNVKTTIAEPPGAAGASVRVRIGEVSERAVVARGPAVPDGELALTTASSGWPLRRGGHRCFVELIVGGGSAAERFHRPRSGTPVGLSG